MTRMEFIIITTATQLHKDIDAVMDMSGQKLGVPHAGVGGRTNLMRQAPQIKLKLVSSSP